MDFQFANLSIEKLIIHQIFQRDESRELVEPKYNTELTILDDQGLDELQDRIIKAIGNDSHCVEMEISNFDRDSTFQNVAKLIYADDEHFIDYSKPLALKLAQSQTSRKIPGGVVVIFKGRIGRDLNNYIGIIKAEKHGGFTITELDMRLILQYLSNLLLTPQQKLYKIAMFIELDELEEQRNRRPDEFKVYVFDHNMNRSETKEAAIYFYDTFLGCSLSPTNKKLTRDFYIYTRDFINNLDINDEEKVDLNYALYAYLKVSQSNTIQISEFAEQFLEGDNRDNYISYMEQKEFPSISIPKDMTYIKNKLKKRRIKFTTDVTISAPSENFKDLVKILECNESSAVVEIMGRVGVQE